MESSHSDIDSPSEGESGTENHTDGLATPPRKKPRTGKAKKKSKQGSSKIYQVKWETEPLFKGWLTSVKDEPSKAKCKCCGTTLNAGHSELEKHAEGKKHLKKVKEAKGLGNIGESFAKVAARSTNHILKENAKKAEIMLSATFAEHNIAIHIVDHLVDVIKNIAPDSEILKHVSLGRTKCTAIIENVIAQTETEELIEELKANHFSVLTDGSTDNTSVKFMIVLVKYHSLKDKKVHVGALELVKLDARDCSAESQFGALKKCFADKGIPMENIVGFGCDNENTMTGEHNSVWSRIRDEVPHAMLMGCTCHSAASTACHACSKIPQHVDELISRIVNFVSGSAKRQAQLEEFQEFFQTEKKKILKLAKTRWLSRQHCIERLIDQWDVLIHFFTVASFEEASYPPSRKKVATEILNEMKNPYNKAYYHFLEYASTFFNEYNALFQSKEVMIHKLRDKSIKLLKDVCQNYLPQDNVDRITTTKIDDPRIYLPNDEIFLGRKCEKYIKECPPQYREGFKIVRKKCLEFYVAAAVDMAARLPALNNKEFDEVRFIDPAVCLSSDERKSLRDLPLLSARFENPLALDLDELSREWRTLPNAFPDSDKERLKKMGPEEFWAEVGSLRSGNDQELFPNLHKLARCVMSLPHSNADCERFFCIVTDVKNKKRNRIGSTCMNAIGVVRTSFKSKGIDCTSFKVKPRHLELHNSDMYAHVIASKNKAASATADKASQ